MSIPSSLKSVPGRTGSAGRLVKSDTKTRRQAQIRPALAPRSCPEPRFRGRERRHIRLRGLKTALSGPFVTDNLP